MREPGGWLPRGSCSSHPHSPPKPPLSLRAFSGVHSGVAPSPQLCGFSVALGTPPSSLWPRGCPVWLVPPSCSCFLPRFRFLLGLTPTIYFLPRKHHSQYHLRVPETQTPVCFRTHVRKPVLDGSHTTTFLHPHLPSCLLRTSTPLPCLSCPGWGLEEAILCPGNRGRECSGWAEVFRAPGLIPRVFS